MTHESPLAGQRNLIKTPASTRTDYLAHSANGNGSGVEEPLRQHIQAVAERARRFAAAFGVEEQAYAAGLVHDLGKYADQFLRRLRDPRERGRDHWTAGAALLAKTSPRLGLFPAIAVLGHHRGLPSLPCDSKELGRRIHKVLQNQPESFTETNLPLLAQRFIEDGFAVPRINQGLVLGEHLAADMLDARMLFSALVDADFLETEAHFNGDAKTPRCPRQEGPALDLDQAIVALDEYLASVRQRCGQSPMAHARETLLKQCLDAASRPTGLFSLSAPTGAGKTLAMLAFALHHARAHGLRRVILVMPFLNIIEQSARIYREVFSADRGFAPNTVLEHHSLAEPSDRDSEAAGGDYDESLPRLLAENWDAPIILTTTVQLLESLFADRPSRCRKLHRLAQSVLLFDEVQTLPLSLVVATLATLSRLTDPAGPYRSTVVFATATQPAFDAFDERVRRQFSAAGWRPAEIVHDAQPLYTQAAQRVQVVWRHETPIDLDDLAAELLQHERVLCIVNLKRHSVRLAMSLRDRQAEGLFHLSTNMCPLHRAAVLAKVNRRLEKGRPVRLVATQCVEAGVDLDFPVVYRAFAPLEAIAQAAGRCNRHGSGPQGQVVVFKPIDSVGLYPFGYREAVTATEHFLAGLTRHGDLNDIEVLNNPDHLRNYFQQFYGLSGRASTEREDERELLEAIRAGDFAEVAKHYRLINQDAIQVLVPYDRTEFDRIRGEIAEVERLNPKFIRAWVHQATPHAVSMFRPQGEGILWNHLEPIQFSRRHAVEDSRCSWFAALPGIEYDMLIGLSQKTEDSWIA
jgi:CRISPR-associated endonuclease/helicase Cas3